MSTWEILSHQVAIAGRVTNAQTKAALPNALVEITAAPPEFNIDNQFAVKEVKTSPDGHFHFLDLPNGNYTLVASLPNAGSRYGTATGEVTVSRNAKGRIVMASVDIPIPATTLQGEVKDTEAEAVVMAQVKVQGSSEQTFSNSQGEYILIGLEATSQQEPTSQQERTILVKASGYQSSSQTVLLNQPGVVQSLDFVLAKE